MVLHCGNSENMKDRGILTALEMLLFRLLRSSRQQNGGKADQIDEVGTGLIQLNFTGPAFHYRTSHYLCGKRLYEWMKNSFG